MALGPILLGTAVVGLIFVVNPATVLASSDGLKPNEPKQHSAEKEVTQHPFVGMWVTGDGRIRHELLPNGRYDEARGTRESAYQGRYEVKGNRIEYWDDTGFTADGEFVDDNTLHHGGMVFRRR